MELKASETKINLMRAFAGESMARNRYNMAHSASGKEGHYAIAKIFDFTAKQEQAHATVFYNFLKEENDCIFDITASYPINVYTKTEDILKSSVHNEYEEHNNIYKNFAEVAASEGFNEISNAFAKIGEIEKIHAQRFENLLNALKGGTLCKSQADTLWVCTNCGHVHSGVSAPVACPVCSHAQGYFVRDSFKEKTTILI